jgi:uncharacterized protein YbjQ (UPF0145 family)
MQPHVFIDESKARHYLLAAAVVQADKIDQLRKMVGALRLPGQRRIHFTTEGDPRRKTILSVMAAAGACVTVYDASAYKDVKQARDSAMAQLVDDAAKMGARRMVIELDTNVVASDRKIIRDRAELAGCLETLSYEHRKASDECLLAIPDAVAWAWAKGGRWRQRAQPLVSAVTKV